MCKHYTFKKTNNLSIITFLLFFVSVICVSADNKLNLQQSQWYISITKDSLNVGFSKFENERQWSFSGGSLVLETNYAIIQLSGRYTRLYPNGTSQKPCPHSALLFYFCSMFFSLSWTPRTTLWSGSATWAWAAVFLFFFMNSGPSPSYSCILSSGRKSLYLSEHRLIRPKMTFPMAESKTIPHSVTQALVQVVPFCCSFPTSLHGNV